MSANDPERKRTTVTRLFARRMGWHEMARRRPPSLPTLKKNANGSVTLYFGNPSCIVLARGGGVSIDGAGNARRPRGATFSTGYLSGQGE